MRDLLATVAAALREACWLATERVARNAPRNVPARAEAVTPAWLTQALQASFPGAGVQAATPLSSDAGTTDRVRVALTYDRVGDGQPPPASVFVKLAPADFKVRLFVNLMRLGTTEVRFYREVAAHLPIELPRVFHAALGGRAQGFAIVFEDLTSRGVRFATAADPVGVDDARLVMRALARLHSRFWDDPRLRDLAWLRSRRHNPRYPVERGLCALAMRPGMRRFPGLVPAELQTAAAGISAARDRLEDAWAQDPLTLIHGDAHVGNMYFVPGAVGLLDWQVVQCGQGMRDVAYFLMNSLATELRRTHQRELISLYLATLAAEGVTAPDFAVAWEQYRLHALYAWIGAVVTAAAASLQAEPVVRAALNRCCTAVMDLDSLAALAGLSEPRARTASR